MQRVTKGGGRVGKDGQGVRGAAAGDRGWGTHAPHGGQEQGSAQAIQESGEGSNTLLYIRIR